MNMKKISPLILVIGALAIVLFWVWGSYNGLIAAREEVNESWAQVKTQYQRRFDLVPNLVNTVKGAAGFEQETLIAVTEARTQWLNAGDRESQIQAAGGFESAFARLLATVESYPQLKATEAFRDLMTQLEGTENRIGTARRDYNATVRSYNLRVKRFPGNLLAGLFGFREETFFQGDEGNETSPTVEF